MPCGHASQLKALVPLAAFLATYEIRSERFQIWIREIHLDFCTSCLHNSWSSWWSRSNLTICSLRLHFSAKQITRITLWVSSVVQLSNSSGCKHGCHLIQGKAVLNKQVDQHCINESGWAKLLICTSNSFTNIVWIQNGEEVASTAGDLAESASKDRQ